MTENINAMPSVEAHPLEPFLPSNAALLMLGSFPPQQKRWSMDFFYPNLQNDMWRIVGIIYFQDKNYFLNKEGNAFEKERIMEFLIAKGIALYDAASSVRRLQDNASDKFLEIVEPTNIRVLLKQLPKCKAIATTGQKATEVLCELLQIKPPGVGEKQAFEFEDRKMTLYRMPSSSRAYPLKIEKKAAAYQAMFEDLNLL